jgi:hypothetical protein
MATYDQTAPSAAPLSAPASVTPLAVVTAPAGGPVTVSALPQVVNLILVQGDDFYLDLVVTNADGSAADLSTATASAQIRKSATDPTIAAAFTASITTNVVHLHLPHAASAPLSSSAVWDCQITTPDITTIAAGTVTVELEVTRP